MSKYLKLFETTSEYNAYIQGGGVILPNVSVAEDAPTTVYYNPWVGTRVVATFNVTSISDPTYILNNTTYFSAVEIDGVKQPSVENEYTFETTGEHTVKYTLIDPTSIGGAAFDSCYDLTSITIPNSVTSIGDWAFNSCESLTSITIPDSVTSIGEGAFSDCTGFTSITIPDSVTSIGNQAFQWCSGLTSITIPDSVTSIGDNVFENCTGLTSIIIPDSVTNIGVYAFSGCESLTSVTIGSGVTSISEGVFCDCDSLTVITIPSGVTSIGDYAFSDSTGLTNIICNATTAPTIQNNTFQNVKTGGTLYVPSGSTGYDVWMGTGNYYLGKYGWTKVEQ